MSSIQSTTPDPALSRFLDGLEQFEMPPLWGGDGKTPPIRPRLHRLPVKDGFPVLLLHGASAASNSFLVPSGNPKDNPCNLACFLAAEKKFEPWLLDWRGSFLVSSAVLAMEEKYRPPRYLFNFNPRGQGRHTFGDRDDHASQERGRSSLGCGRGR